MGRILRTLVPKLETTGVKSIPKRSHSKNICTGQVLKLLREGDNFGIRNINIGQGKSPSSYIVKN